MKLLKGSYLLLQLFNLPLWSQSDTLLPEISIQASRPHALDTVHVQHEKVWSMQTLGSYLQAHGYGQMQSYGAEGTLQYLRFRGTSSDYTTVYWNDIPLNSITLGGVDVSLSPMFFFDQLETDRTQMDATRQWNNVSNGLYLNSGHTLESNGLQVKALLQGNSLYNWSTGTSVQWLRAAPPKSDQSHAYRHVLQGSSRWMKQSYRNDFDYVDQFQIERPTVRQTHNNGGNQGHMQTLSYKHRNHQVNADWWMQDRHMLLPQRMGISTPSNQEQDDAFNRMNIRYLYSRASWKFKWILASSSERLIFRDMPQDDGRWLLDSRVIARMRFAQGVYQYSYKSWLRTTAACMAVQNEVNNTNFTNGALRLNYYQTAFDLHLGTTTHQLHGGARREWRPTPTQWNWNVAYLYNKYLKRLGGYYQGQLQISHRFRTPDLNDLYWIPGGNPDLLPEQGLHVELHQDVNWQITAHARLNMKANVYYTDMNQLIVWAPENNGYWVPHNTSNALTKGVDLALRWGYIRNDWKLELRGRGQWNESKSGSTYLIYAPQWIHSAVMQVTKGHWQLESSQVYTSSRFTDAQNKNILSLPAYMLFHAHIGYQWTIKSQDVLVQFGAMNCTNQVYQSVRGVPMPGRVFQIQCIYQFSHIKSKDENKTNVHI
jgi:vitamin B12 transporter